MGEQQLPNYADAAKRLIQQEANPEADAAVVRIRYSENGVIMVEDFYTSIVYVRALDNLNYAPSEVFSLRTTEGRLEGNSAFLYSLYRMITVDPVWYANLFNIGTIALQQRQNQVEMAGIISSMLVKNANEIQEAIKSTWEENEKTRAYILNNATDTILGLEDYRNPNTSEEIKLPNNYQSIWWGIDGSYIYSNNPNFNPNLNGGNIEYYRMQKLS